MTIKKIIRKGNTMATYYAPPGQEYSKEAFQKIATWVAAQLKPVHWGAVAEPFPDEAERKSSWHFHMMLAWKDDYRKQITAHMQKKIEEFLRVPACTHDYTSSNKSNALQKCVNDAKYATGRSVKDETYEGPKSGRRKEKSHYAVIKSAGFDDWLAKKEEALESFKEEKASLGNYDISNPETYSYALMKGRNYRPWEIHEFAEKEGNMALELYVIKNLSQLEERYNNLKKVMAERKINREEELEPNAFQKGAIQIIENTSAKRDEGQLNVFVDKKGNSGKSVLQSMLYKKYEAPEFPNAKTADIAKAYSYEPMVNFNFARHVDMEKVNYCAIENLLDGKIFSSKYHSGLKRVSPPKINIFANEFPTISKLSFDRWNIHEWDGKVLRTLTDREKIELNNSQVHAELDKRMDAPFQPRKRQRTQYGEY